LTTTGMILWKVCWRLACKGRRWHTWQSPRMGFTQSEINNAKTIVSVKATFAALAIYNKI
jgi:hypothetical protein